MKVVTRTIQDASYKRRDCFKLFVSDTNAPLIQIQSYIAATRFNVTFEILSFLNQDLKITKIDYKSN